MGQEHETQHELPQQSQNLEQPRTHKRTHTPHRSVVVISTYTHYIMSGRSGKQESGLLFQSRGKSVVGDKVGNLV